LGPRASVETEASCQRPAKTSATAAPITGSVSTTATTWTRRESARWRSMLKITSAAKPHQETSARLGEAGKPIIPNRSQAACPTSQQAAAADHSVHRARLAGAAARRAASVPISALSPALVQATSQHSWVESHPAAATPIASTASTAGSQTTAAADHPDCSGLLISGVSAREAPT